MVLRVGQKGALVFASVWKVKGFAIKTFFSTFYLSLDFLINWVKRFFSPSLYIRGARGCFGWRSLFWDISILSVRASLVYPLESPCPFRVLNEYLVL